MEVSDILNEPERLKHQRFTTEKTSLILEIQKAIWRAERKPFDKFIKRYEGYLKTVVIRDDVDYICDLFVHSLRQPNKYYRNVIYKLNAKYSTIIKEDPEMLRIAIRENDVRMAHRFVKDGANLSHLDSLCCTPLEDAIRCNNFEMVCMLLYYGAYTNNIENNLTSFMFSIICQSSEEIQRLLMEYETDFNLSCDGESILFMAIKYKSPLVFDLIERGADLTFTQDCIQGSDVAIFMAIQAGWDVDSIEKFWTMFEYNVECDSTSRNSIPSILCQFITHRFLERNEIRKYLHIFLENEEKLRLDIENHDDSNCRYSLLGVFYSTCIVKELFNEHTIQNFILHLLSHGAKICTSDVDLLYSLSTNKESHFLEILMSMDLEDKPASSTLVTFIYFKYTLHPDLEYFLTQLLDAYIISECTERTNIADVRDAIKRVSKLFAMQHQTRQTYQDVFSEDDVVAISLEQVICFPSLIQLSRDASRSFICKKYNIQHIRQFYDIINQLEIPNFIKLLLTYQQNIYTNR